MLSPVEKMAAKLLKRHNLVPPYDLPKLVRRYGDLDYVKFPIDADGVTIGIGGQERPSVLINSDAARVRQNFTLAHELGHIIIPWHTGTIVSHPFDQGFGDFEYEVMEGEANRFAAELLMPTQWVLECAEDYPDFVDLVEYVLESSGASREAVLIKIFNVLPAPIFCARVDAVGSYIKSYRTQTAPYHSDLKLLNLYEDEVFRAPHKLYRFSLSDFYYVAWVFDGFLIEEVDDRTWRDLLRLILDETGLHHKLQSINATLASAYRKNQHLDEAKICGGIVQAYDVKVELSGFVQHPLFEQYVIKRVKELQARG